MKDVVVQGEGKRGAVWMKSREMVGLLPCGKVVTGDRRRCEVKLRGLPKKNGSIGEVPGGGVFASLWESRGWCRWRVR